MIILVLLLVIRSSECQASTIWKSPPNLLTGRAIIISSSNNHGIFFTSIKFSETIINPIAKVALLTMYNITSNNSITLGIQIAKIRSTQLTTKFTLTNFTLNLLKVQISYLVYQKGKFDYIQIHQHDINCLIISQNKTQTRSTQQYQIAQYIQIRNPNHSYHLEGNLRGYSMNCLIPQLSLQLHHYNDSHYLIQISTNVNCEIYKLSYNRLLLDNDMIESLNVRQLLNDQRVQLGVSLHYAFNQLPNIPTSVLFFQNSIFQGISKFNNKIVNLQQKTIFQHLTNNPSNLTITYLSIKVKTCPPSYSVYDQNSTDCYLSSTPYHYLANGLCYTCHYTCFTCSGPSSNQCLTCLDGSERQISINQCLCQSGYYNNGSSIQCTKCSSVIQGCYKCTSASNCTECFTNCSFISSSNCSCTWAVTACGLNEIYDLQSGKCRCKQQYFKNNITNTCDRCSIGCYICQYYSYYCYECIEYYLLIENNCVQVIISSELLNGGKNYPFQVTRCLNDVNGECNLYCNDSLPVYQSTCFKNCPIGTFQLSYPYNLCHPCQISCIECSDYNKCNRCQINYYLNHDIKKCKNCRANCFRCTNATNCLQPYPGFTIKYKNTTTTTFFTNTTTNITTNVTITTTQIYMSGSNVQLNNICMVGCDRCFISTICQVCNKNYLRLNNMTCFNCSSNLTIIVNNNCKEVCGDGILLSQQCDDNNNKSGDGCSDLCKIEEGYNCHYVQSRQLSLCYSNNFTIKYNLLRSLINNSVTVQFTSTGVNISNIDINTSCQFKYNITTLLSTDKLIKYSLSYDNSIEGSLCLFVLSNITSIKLAISTYPSSIYLDFQGMFQKIISFVMSTIGTPLIYVTFVFIILGLSPFSLWLYINSLNLYILSLFDAYNKPANIYILQPFLLSFQLLFSPPQGIFITKDKSLINLSLIYLSSLLMIIFMINQLILRKFIQMTCLRAVKNIMSLLYQERKFRYLCVHSALQPILIYFSCLALINRTDILSIVVACINILVSLVVFIVFMYEQQNKKKEQIDGQWNLVVLGKIQNIVLAITVGVSSYSYEICSKMSLISCIILFIFACFSRDTVAIYERFTNVQFLICLTSLLGISLVRIYAYYSSSFIQNSGKIILVVSFFGLFFTSCVFFIIISILRFLHLLSLPELSQDRPSPNFSLNFIKSSETSLAQINSIVRD